MFVTKKAQLFPFSTQPQQQSSGGMFDKMKQLGNTAQTAYKFNNSMNDLRKGGQGMMQGAGGVFGAVPQMGSHFGNALNAAQQFGSTFNPNNPFPGAINAGMQFGNAALGALGTGANAAHNFGNFLGSAAQFGGALPGVVTNGLKLMQQTGRMPQLPFGLSKMSAFELGVKTACC